jgi:hypothetical protein
MNANQLESQERGILKEGLFEIRGGDPKQSRGGELNADFPVPSKEDRNASAVLSRESRNEGSVARNLRIRDLYHQLL